MELITRKANQLLADWELCNNVQLKADVIALRLEIDSCRIPVHILQQELIWGSSIDALIVACDILEPKLTHLMEKIVITALRS